MDSGSQFMDVRQTIIAERDRYGMTACDRASSVQMRYSINFIMRAQDFISATDQCNSCQEQYPEEFLEAFSLGAQENGKAIDFEAHIIVCSMCQVRLAEAERWIKDVREAFASEFCRPAKGINICNFSGSTFKTASKLHEAAQGSPTAPNSAIVEFGIADYEVFRRRNSRGAGR